jgi:hypothetical protein
VNYKIYNINILEIFINQKYKELQDLVIYLDYFILVNNLILLLLKYSPSFLNGFLNNDMLDIFLWREKWYRKEHIYNIRIRYYYPWFIKLRNSLVKTFNQQRVSWIKLVNFIFKLLNDFYIHIYNFIYILWMFFMVLFLLPFFFYWFFVVEIFFIWYLFINKLYFIW